jgi:hypothetical protein
LKVTRWVGPALPGCHNNFAGEFSKYFAFNGINPRFLAFDISPFTMTSHNNRRK